MLVKIGTEQYAVESRLLGSVQPATGLTPVPCTPAHVAGILNVRGDIVTVLNLGTAIGLVGPSQHDEHAVVLLVEYPQVRVGLLVDEVLGVCEIALDELDHAFSGQEFVRGVAESKIVLLDLVQLLSGDRFDVLEEVS
jgi:purine-binding chemotaxis protein CheW